MSLSHEDVQEILRLLDETEYDELKLETDRFKLTLKRTADGNWQQEQHTAKNGVDTTEVLQDAESSTGSDSTDSSESIEENTINAEGLLEIRAPMVGTYYRSPKPGADHFVEVGSTIEDNAVIGIIEVMKLMNSIPAGVSGEIVDIVIEDAQFVEKGQLLMRVRPTN